MESTWNSVYSCRPALQSQSPSTTSIVSEFINVLPRGAILDYKIYNARYSKDTFKLMWEELYSYFKLESEEVFKVIEGYKAKNVDGTGIAVLMSSNVVIMVSGLDLKFLDTITKEECSFTFDSLVTKVTQTDNQSFTHSVECGLKLFQYLCHKYIERKVMWLHVNKHKLYLKSMYDRSLKINRLFSNDEDLYDVLNDYDTTILYGKPGSGKTYEINNLIFRHGIRAVYLRMSDLDSSDYVDIKNILEGSDNSKTNFFAKFFLIDKNYEETFRKDFKERLVNSESKNTRKVIFCFDGIDLVPEVNWEIVKQIVIYLKRLPSVQTLITARRENSFLKNYLKNLERDMFQTINLPDIQEKDVLKMFELDYLINKYSDKFINMNAEQLERTFKESKDLALKYTLMPKAINYFQAAFPVLTNQDQITSRTFIEMYHLLLRKSLNDLHVEEMYYYPLEDQYLTWIKALKQYTFMKLIGENVQLNDSSIQSRKFCMNNSDELVEFLFAEYFHAVLSNEHVIHGNDKVYDLNFFTMIFTQGQFYFVRALLDEMVEGVEVINSWDENQLKSFNKDKILTVLIEEKRFNILRVLSKLRLEENALRITARDGNKETLKLLISVAPNMMIDKSYKNALLHVATINNQNVVEQLSRQLQDRDAQDCTALHLVVQNDEIKLVEEILQENAGIIDCQNKAGETALNIAAKKGFLSILKFLIEQNANLEVADNDGFTPFLSAVVSGNCQAVLNLIHMKCRTDVECKLGFKAIHYAAGKKCAEIVSSLIENNKAVLHWVSRKQQFTALHIAASTNHLKTVKILVEEGSNVNALDCEHRTPLHVAAGMDAYEVVEYFISDECTSVNINARCKSGYTPLHLAAKNGDSDIVMLFFDKRKNDLEINTRNDEGLTPIHSALNCVKNFLPMLNVCVIDNKFLDINSTNKWNETLLSFCIRQQINAIELVSSSLICNADTEIKNQDGFNCFHFAAFQGNLSVMKDLREKVKNHDDINSLSLKRYTPLYIVAGSQSHREIEKLLSWGADITLYDENGVSPLHLVCYYHKYTMVDMLAERYAKENLINLQTKNGSTALHFAIYSGSVEVARLLLRKYKADMYIKDKKEYSALHVAAYYARLNIAEMLLDRTVEKGFLNFQTQDGSTALNLAAQQGGIDTVRLLLESDANAELADKQGFLPIHSAAYQGDTKIFECLLKKNEDTLAKQTMRGSTPLFLAVKENRVTIVKLLLEKHSQSCGKSRFSPFLMAALKGHTDILKMLYLNDKNIINDKDEIGRTALYLAAMEGKKDAVDFLLENKADVGIRQIKGWCPVHIAAYQGHNEIVKSIIEGDIKWVNALTNLGDSPLHFAAWTGNKHLIEYLVGKGNEKIKTNKYKNKFDITPLDYAVSRGFAHPRTSECEEGCKQCSLFKLFDEQGYELSFLLLAYNESNIEYEAVKGNNIEMVEYLATELKTNFKQPVLSKLTPLHAAAKIQNLKNVNSHLRVLKYLGELKYDLNVVIEELNETPLYVAVMDGALASVKTLVEMGADASIGDQNGWTPLHAAVKCDNPQIVDYLCIKCNHTINIGSKFNLTALYVGVQYSCFEAVHVLMKHLADPTIGDDNGWNPLRVAEYEYSKYSTNNKEKYKILLDEIRTYTNNYSAFKNRINQIKKYHQEL